MQTRWGTTLTTVAATAALGGGLALGAGDFPGFLKTVQDSLAAAKKVGKDYFKLGKVPDEKVAATVTKAQEDLIKSFVDGCPPHDKIAFSDASHYADPKALKEWKLASEAPADAQGVIGAKVRFYATWSAAPAAAAPDVVVTICELPQRVCTTAGVSDSSTKFTELGKDVKNAQVADILQALADDWARTNKDAAIQKPAKKSAGIAKWFASATAKTGDGTDVVRRDWYAWETQGVSWLVQGTTWVATVRFSNAAAADAKALAKPEELFKKIVAVIP